MDKIRAENEKRMSIHSGQVNTDGDNTPTPLMPTASSSGNDTTMVCGSYGCSVTRSYLAPSQKIRNLFAELEEEPSGFTVESSTDDYGQPLPAMSPHAVKISKKLSQYGFNGEVKEELVSLSIFLVRPS